MNKGTLPLVAAKRATARSASLVHIDMKRGLNTVASVAATAPLVGSVGTVIGIFNTFGGGSTERSTLMFWMLKHLTQSMVPTALGLVVALLAFCGYKYLLARLEGFDFEMKCTSLQLINDLAHLPSTKI
jgi:biopolymer transport protein ExbB